jgi:uncharacterized protein (DUF488 family)
MNLLTIGHGTASAEEFADLIMGAEIKTLVDVRSVPKSRRHPQFWLDAMAIWVPQLADSAYEWKEQLGGFRRTRPDSANIAWRHPAFRGYADYMETEQFHQALESLLAEAAKQSTAIMCSETLWWRCHRRLISDAAVLLHNLEVLHLFHDGKLVPHMPTRGVRVLKPQQLRYDVITDDDRDR